VGSAGTRTPPREQIVTRAGSAGTRTPSGKRLATHAGPAGQSLRGYPVKTTPSVDREPETFTVPPEFLEPVDRDDFAGIDRDEAALLLDGYLIGLSRRESVCRLLLGRLTDSLLRTRAHHRLGFARLGDYALERLGISGRELELVAQVWRKLRELPALARAYSEGRLNWTKLRLLSAVASDESVEDWLAKADCSTSRELERMIRRGENATRAGAAATVGAANGAADTGTANGTAVATAAANGIAATTGAADGAAATAAVTAALNEGDEDPEQIDGEPRLHLRIRCPPRVRLLWRTVFELASRSSGSVLAAWQALELVAAEAMSGLDPARLAPAAPSAGDPFQGRSSAGDPARVTADPAHTIAQDEKDDDWSAELREHLARANPFEAKSGSQDVLETMLDRAEPCELPPADLDRELRARLRAMQAIDWQMGSLLRTFGRLRLYRNAGYSSLAAYVADRLGISARKARGLIRLEANYSAEHVAVSQAYRTGRISWVRALVLLPIVSEQYAGHWIERACEVTVRRLIEEVRWASDLRDRTGGIVEVAPPPLGAPLESTAAEAERHLRAQVGDQMAAQVLQAEPIAEVVLGFSGPASVIGFVYDVLRAYTGPYEAPWQGFERVLMHAKEAWATIPRHRNPIHDRDGWRCRVPACGSRRNLQEHHLLFRSQGGDNTRANRVSICAWHHLRGIHRGIVGAHGDATKEVRWQLGLGAAASGAAFLTFHNDVYAT
jgi:hypothetical protein